SSEPNTIVNTTSKVRWKRPIGSARVRECSATAVATQGCASWRSRARPAPKKMTASLSIRQVIEAGPKMPSTDPAASAWTASRAASRSLSETNAHLWKRTGIGLFRASLQSIAIQLAKALKTLLRAAKRESDPEGILNPGVLIDA